MAHLPQAHKDAGNPLLLGQCRRGKLYRRNDPDNESRRWQEHVERVRQRLGPLGKVIHVMDREGDSYALLDAMARSGERFVVRAAHDRVVSLPPELRAPRPGIWPSS